MTEKAKNSDHNSFKEKLIHYGKVLGLLAIGVIGLSLVL